MSGPYDQYNQGYGSQYPSAGYSQPGYSQGGYDPQQQPPPPSQSQYPPQQDYSQQGGQGYGAQDFGPPRRADSFGPPQHGGFQHGQAGQQFGAYDASNPQGNADYYGNSGGYQSPGQPQHDSYYGAGAGPGAADQPYGGHQDQQQPSYGGNQPTSPDPTTAYPDHQWTPQSTDPNAPNYDPNAPPMTETDRGLMGAIGGAWGGHHFGKKQGHGIIGLLAGAVGGSMLEDFAKKKKHEHSGHHGGGSSYSQSSWGGGKW